MLALNSLFGKPQALEADVTTLGQWEADGERSSSELLRDRLVLNMPQMQSLSGHYSTSGKGRLTDGSTLVVQGELQVLASFVPRHNVEDDATQGQSAG